MTSTSNYCKRWALSERSTKPSPKSLMVEFLRLKIIIGDDLSGALRTWQTNMEVATDKFLRDLDAATQTSTTLPSKHAAVGVLFRQFHAATQLRVALPLT